MGVEVVLVVAVVMVAVAIAAAAMAAAGVDSSYQTLRQTGEETTGPHNTWSVR